MWCLRRSRVLAEGLRFAPGDIPGKAETAADEDFRVVNGLFVVDSVGDEDLSGDGAAFEVAKLIFQVAA